MKLFIQGKIEFFHLTIVTKSNVHTDNYHSNNNKVPFVGAILLYITNRCVSNTIYFLNEQFAFCWTYLLANKEFCYFDNRYCYSYFFQKTTLLLKQIRFCFNDLLHTQLIFLHTQLILPL